MPDAERALSGSRIEKPANCGGPTILSCRSSAATASAPSVAWLVMGWLVMGCLIGSAPAAPPLPLVDPPAPSETPPAAPAAGKSAGPTTPDAAADPRSLAPLGLNRASSSDADADADAGADAAEAAAEVDGAVKVVGPASDRPELLPLNAFVGEWQVEIRRDGDDRVRRGRAVTAWSHRGNFLKTEFTVDDGVEGTTFTTYDAGLRRYRRWTFDVSGGVIEYLGEYDKSSGVWAFRHSAASQHRELISESKFEDNGSERWRLVVKDDEGQVLREYRGVNRRAE